MRSRNLVDWYCSEPRLAFNRTVILRYRIFLEQRQLAATTINLRLAAVRRVAYEAADSGLRFASNHSAPTVEGTDYPPLRDYPRFIEMRD